MSRPIKLTDKAQEVYEMLLSARTALGTAAVDEGQRAYNRARLEADVKRNRGDRKKFQWPKDYEWRYKKQGGICPRCTKDMRFIRGELHIDHFNPEAKSEEFNSDENLRLLHRTCNASKGSNNIYDEAKKAGLTVKEYLQTHQQ